MTQAPAGWYPQPDGTQRYWDGAAWTEHVAPGSAAAAPAEAAPVVEPVLPTPEVVSPVEVAPVAETPIAPQHVVPPAVVAPAFVAPGAPKKKSRVPLVLGIIGGFFVLVIVAVVLLVMFVFKAASGPKDAVNDFVAAVNLDDCEAMAAIASERYKEENYLTSCDGYESGDQTKYTYSIDGVTTSGSTASVTGTLTDPADDQTYELDFGLVKVDGSWKIDELTQS